jgi:hypothetical protein
MMGKPQEGEPEPRRLSREDKMGTSEEDMKARREIALEVLQELSDRLFTLTKAGGR